MSLGADEEKAKEFKVYPIGYVRKTDDKTTIVLHKKYEPALLRMEKQSEKPASAQGMPSYFRRWTC